MAPGLSSHYYQAVLEKNRIRTLLFLDRLTKSFERPVPLECLLVTSGCKKELLAALSTKRSFSIFNEQLK